MSDMQGIKQHFNEEAQQYDDIIMKLIPYYHQMIEALINALPFDKSEEIEVIDMGCGTGTVSKAVKDAFPKATMTCFDISENMLKIAHSKLNDFSDTIYINSDFYKFDFNKKFNAAVSSLALHHIVTKEEKLDFYKKIYSGLKDGGVFVNADVVLASTEILQNCYIDKWIDYMCQNVPRDEVENKWIPTHYNEDKPASLTEHLEMLKEAGFNVVDVVWKYYNFAVYIAVK